MADVTPTWPAPVTVLPSTTGLEVVVILTAPSGSPISSLSVMLIDVADPSTSPAEEFSTTSFATVTVGAPSDKTALFA